MLWSPYAKPVPLLCLSDATTGMLLLPITALAGPFLHRAAGMLSPCDGTRRDAVIRTEISTEGTCC